MATYSPDTFVLRSSPTSPFVRKVLMAAAVLGVSERLVLQPVDTQDKQDMLIHQNPLGKYPCLVLPSGEAVYGSGVILEFLQTIADDFSLLPTSGQERISLLTQAGLADGIIDAGALVIYEMRFHGPEKQSTEWIEHQLGKMRRALAAFEKAPPNHSVTNAVTIGLSCALGFLDRRQLLDWRHFCPHLVTWLDAFSMHEPAFRLTQPPPQ